MDPNDAKVIAARNLTKGATLDDLQEVARDYSALADAVEARIERVQAATPQTDHRVRLTALGPSAPFARKNHARVGS